MIIMFIELANMVDATQEVEWGGVGGRLFTVVMFTIYPPVMFTVYPPYAETNSCLRSMRYVLGPIGDFNACVRRVWNGSVVLQRLQHFTISKSSTGILWYVAFDISQCHESLVRNCKSHNVTSF